LTIDFLIGFDAFLWFGLGHGGYDSQYGTWGWTDSMLTKTSPKKEGILYVASETAVPLNYTVFTTLGKTEYTVAAINHALSSGAYSTSYLPDYAMSLNSTFYYPLIFTARGYYNISVETQISKANSNLAIYINNVNVGTLFFDKVTTKFNYTTLAANVIVEKGLNVITLRTETDRGYAVNSVKVVLSVEVADPTPPVASPKVSTSAVTNRNNTNPAISKASGAQQCSWLLVLLALLQMFFY